jgi:hypothetical protein
MAGDIKPVQIAIDSVANVFAGSEISRTSIGLSAAGTRLAPAAAQACRSQWDVGDWG